MRILCISFVLKCFGLNTIYHQNIQIYNSEKKKLISNFETLIFQIL